MLTAAVVVGCLLAVIVPAVAVGRRASARSAASVQGTLNALAAMERAGGRSTESGGGADVSVPRRRSDDVRGVA
ncbi:MAG TPA: hypothetical protein VFH45_11575 [Acidimicrobiales bacterium]|nr:hypothetical protein [Acidimicrobiales bacterium]